MWTAESQCSMPEKTVVLKTDSQLRRFLVKGLILTMPYWLLMGGAVTVYWIMSWRLGIQNNPVWFGVSASSYCFVLASIASFFLSQNKISVKADSIQLPWPASQSIAF